MGGVLLKDKGFNLTLVTMTLGACYVFIGMLLHDFFAVGLGVYTLVVAWVLCMYFGWYKGDV